jgi:hypothetical protein
MPEDTINITLDRQLWEGLSKFAHEQSIKQNKQYPIIRALRLAIWTFLKMEPNEISEVLKRNTHNTG